MTYSGEGTPVVSVAMLASEATVDVLVSSLLPAAVSMGTLVCSTVLSEVAVVTVSDRGLSWDVTDKEVAGCSGVEVCLGVVLVEVCLGVVLLLCSGVPPLLLTGVTSLYTTDVPCAGLLGTEVPSVTVVVEWLAATVCLNMAE